MRKKHSEKGPESGGPTFSLKNRCYRGLWKLSWLVLCRWTPPYLWRWRRIVLRVFGAEIGSPVDVRGSARIWYPPNLEMADWSMLAENVECYNPAPVCIEAGVLVSQRAHLCTASHNIHVDSFPLVCRPIRLRNRVWVAAEAFIGPGVTVGEGAVIGARAAVFVNLEPWKIYRGNPAEAIKSRTKVDYMSPALRDALSK